MNNHDVSVSVVIPVYNSEFYIEKTLDTIFAQSCLPMEVLVIDDGSKDNTVKVIEKYRNLHANTEIIRIFEQKNAGAGAARNKGIANALGNWIMFLDSDDLWEKQKIQTVVEVIQNKPDVGIVTHNEYEVTENDRKHRRFVPRHKSYQKDENLFLQLYKGNLFSTSCMTVRKDILEKAGGFDEMLLSAQDYDLWIRISLYAQVIYLEEPLATYVVRKGNITSNTYRRYKCEIRICQKYAPQIKEQLGVQAGKKVIQQRIFQIHKMEAYLALKNRQLETFFKVILSFPKEMVQC